MKTFIKLLAILFLITSVIDAQIKEDTVEVGTGWNIIGALHTGLVSEIVRSEPPDIITSAFFGYNPGGGYESKDTLKKGRGYWVKVNEDGMIIFHYTAANLPPYQPSNPNPVDYSTGVDTNVTLSWTCSDPEGDPLTYDVYFGTDNPPVTKVSSEQTGTSLDRNGLSQGTTYYWKVVAKDDHNNSTSGPVWEFTTAIGGTCPGIPTVYYEGKIYNTVLIGSQCWLRENLDVGVRINGPENASNNGTIEKYCPNNYPPYCDIYGGLYQWDEAMQYSTTPGSRGICPPGWHIPTIEEFQTLSNTVGGDGNALKAIGQGSYPSGAGTNSSGFSALLAGGRGLGGEIGNLSIYAHFWSSKEADSDWVYDMTLYYGHSEIILDYNLKGGGFSVRCLKD